MITIDGAQGEGGGQIVRSALGLALVTGQSVALERIRAGRQKPGLMRQHLTAVQAAAAVGNAQVRGATLGSRQLTFTPQTVTGGEYHFAVGSAGSTTLVLQTILPALLAAPQPSRLRLEGGTHNPYAPPFDFLAQTFLPVLNRLGPQVEATLERPGFYPAGGGVVTVTVTPATRLVPLDLSARGALRHVRGVIKTAHLPPHIASREIKLLGRKLGLDAADLETVTCQESPGPGNVITIEIAYEHVTEVVTAFGRKGVAAEAVAAEAVEAAQRFLKRKVPVGEHLTDQLLLPLVLAGGTFCTQGLSPHARTNIDVIQAFTDARFDLDPTPDGLLVRFDPDQRLLR